MPHPAWFSRSPIRSIRVRLEDANNPPGFFLNNPTLAATAPKATPGGTVTAIGSNFPVNTTTSLSLEFPTPRRANRQGPGEFNGQIYPCCAARIVDERTCSLHLQSHPDLDNTYMFEARCGDQASWSQWGPPFPLSTATESVVELLLWPVVGGQY